MVGRDEHLDDFHGNFLPKRGRPKRLAAIRGDNFHQGNTRGNFRHAANMQCGKSTLWRGFERQSELMVVVVIGLPYGLKNRS
jgi:hypothetical protein